MLLVKLLLPVAHYNDYLILSHFPTFNHSPEFDLIHFYLLLGPSTLRNFLQFEASLQSFTKSKSI